MLNRARMHKVSRAIVLAGLTLGSATALATSASGVSPFADPLDVPAAAIGGVMRPAGQPAMAVARVGTRLLAVGLRGVIVYSDDGGTSWRQAAVPVQSDLVAVNFPDTKNGWAVGHDGVILATTDAGENWTKQIDGRDLSSWAQIYRDRIADGEKDSQAYLDQIRLNTQDVAALPWLGVWFADAMNGYVVGSFGMVAHTWNGGKTWVPALEKVENPDFLNLNAISRIGDSLYIVGERGLVLRFDDVSNRFTFRGAAYKGSFFGITGDKDALIAYGLRGTLYRSRDQGQSWLRLPSVGTATVTAGLTLADGRVILANEAGQVLTGFARQGEFRLSSDTAPAPATDLLDIGDGRQLLSGYQGLRVTSPFATVTPSTK